MPNIFGLNIASIVAGSIASAGGVRSGVLTKTAAGTRTPGSLIDGTNPVLTTFTFQGFKETKADRRPGQIAASSIAVVSILSATVAAVPEVNDTVTMDGETFTLLELLDLDPAEALYQFRAE